MRERTGIGSFGGVRIATTIAMPDRDHLLEVAGEKPAGLADLFRRIWRLGASGVEVPLKLARNGAISEVKVRSADRSDFLKKPHLH